ncbi:MAG: chemotaxis protein CheW [Dissulfurispiraceae bacterium]
MDALLATQDSLVVVKAQGKRSDLLQLVTFGLGGEEYAVDILKVQEINRMKEITRVPNAPSYVEGVINLRGKVMPVIDLRKKFGLDSKENDAQSRIMIIDVQGMTVGLVVDAVSEVLRIPSDIVDPTPQVAAEAGTEFITGIAKLEDRLIILLDMDRLIGKTVDMLTLSQN